MGNCFTVDGEETEEDVSSHATAGTQIVEGSHSSSASDQGEQHISGNFTTPRDEHDILSSTKLKVFTYNELRTATGNFRYDGLIGKGGFGYVYKGWIDEQTLKPARPKSGMPVAIKKLKRQGSQGHGEWLAEVDMLDQLKHPNLVKLIGFCREEENRLLVYEYMSKGSLGSNLFTLDALSLTWERRIKIAIGAARGLAFLHSPELPVIFRDFKTANILLDSEYNAKLSDFGFARAAATGDTSHVSTRITGTIGYVDPEYVTTRQFTTKSDVYSFGVVLFELLAGRPALDSTKPGRENLLDYVKLFLGDERRISRITDMKLWNHYPKKAAYKVSMLAARCTGNLEGRPTMAEVVEALEQLPAADSSPQSSPKRGSSA